MTDTSEIGRKHDEEADRREHDEEADRIETEIRHENYRLKQRVTQLTLLLAEAGKIAGWLHDYADCLHEQAGWCSSEEDTKNLKDEAAEVIKVAIKFDKYEAA